jgi:hypothetical protein
MVGAINKAHSALADEFLDLVRAQPGSWLD